MLLLLSADEDVDDDGHARRDETRVMTIMIIMVIFQFVLVTRGATSLRITLCRFHVACACIFTGFGKMVFCVLVLRIGIVCISIL